MHDLNPHSYFDFQGLRVFHHPRYTEPAQNLQHKLQSLKLERHLALFSSGTSSNQLKGYVLSLRAMEANADAVNKFFHLGPADIWGLSLPDYHVGGLSVLMRASLLGNRVVDCRQWEPESWHQKISREKVTITTVVPTQVYDLVQKSLRSPESLRYLIVGGDFLSSELESRAHSLGWPVIRTYGMSEVCSQLASGKHPRDSLKLLPIHEVKTTPEGRLLVKSPALFSYEFRLTPEFQINRSDELCDKDGFYLTQDRVKLEGEIISPMGRIGDEIKVGGHLVNVLALKDALATILLKKNLYSDVDLLISPDERKGQRLVLLHLETVSSKDLNEIRERLAPHVFDEVRPVKNFERTDLGKLKKI